jgi:hypothetical protein
MVRGSQGEPSAYRPQELLTLTQASSAARVHFKWLGHPTKPLRDHSPSPLVEAIGLVSSGYELDIHPVPKP